MFNRKNAMRLLSKLAYDLTCFKWYRCFLGVASLLLFTNGYCEMFPRGCEVTGFGYNGGHLVVNNTGRQSYFMIYNHSNLPIKMQRVETRDVFMSPPLTTKIDPANWAAFASDVSDFHFECLIEENDAITALNCHDVLDVCEYPRVKFALSNMGNYWVSTNKTQQQVINDAVGKGIYLKW